MFKAVLSLAVASVIFHSNPEAKIQFTDNWLGKVGTGLYSSQVPSASSLLLPYLTQTLPSSGVSIN